MMEDDNRVYYRVRGTWRVADAGVELGVRTEDGWPLVDMSIRKYCEILVWRGKVIKDRWNTYNRAEFLEGIKGL